LVLLGTFPPSSNASDAEAFWKQINARSNALSHRPEVKRVLVAEGFRVPADDDDSDPPIVDRRSTDNWRILFASVNLVRIEKRRQMEGGQAFYRGRVGSELASSLATTWDLPTALGSRRIPISAIQGDQDYVEPSASSWTALRRSGSPLAPCVTVDVIERAG